jgi:hypothetical protein
LSLQPISHEQIDAILPFLDRFEAVGFSAGTWRSPLGRPWFSFNETVIEFQRMLLDHGWVNRSFDWTKWQDTAKGYVSAPDRIESADAETIQRLFTTHVRRSGSARGTWRLCSRMGMSGRCCGGSGRYEARWPIEREDDLCGFLQTRFFHRRLCPLG